MPKKNNTPSTKVITGPRTRWSYVNVWEPKSIQGSEPKYSVNAGRGIGLIKLYSPFFVILHKSEIVSIYEFTF